MKNLFLALALFVGVTASITGEARDVRPQAATASATGRGVFYNNLYWSCPAGLRPRAFYSGGITQVYTYVYPYGYMLTNVWIPGPGVYCLP